MSPICYKILEAETNEDLQDMVHRAIADGFVPCGGVAVVTLERGLEGNKFIDLNYMQAVCSPAALLPAANWLAEKLKSQCRSKSKTSAASRSVQA